jgi:hypothetical protein
LLHLPVGERLLEGVAQPLSATSLKLALDTFTSNLPALAWPAFSLSPAPTARVAASQGPDMVDALNMLTLLLPGTPLPLFGDELGKLFVYVSPQDFFLFIWKLPKGMCSLLDDVEKVSYNKKGLVH